MGENGSRPEALGSHGDSRRGTDESRSEELAADEVDVHGGDPACWLERVCDRCGGLSDAPPGSRCDRCGAPGR